MKNKTSILGILLACATIFIWGITFVCTKTLVNSGFSALEILFFRFILAYLALWLMKPKFMKLPSFKDNILFVFAGLTGVTIYQLSENMAISFTNASNVSVIVSICPLFTAIIAQIFFKEKHINRWFMTGFIVSISGVLLVSLNGTLEIHLSPKGDLLALFAAISWGFYSLFISLINKKNLDPICCTRRVFFFAIIFMIPLVISGTFAPETSTFHCNWNPEVNAERFRNISSWLNLGFLGIFASAFCFSAWNKACELLGTVKTTAGLYLIPVITIIFAFIFLGEKITPMGAAGTILTITGLFISSKKS